MFSHLNVHSTYSKMSGTASPQALIEQARACRMSHLALTEVNGLWGFIRFVQQARDNGILPIAGANVITEHDEAVLLAETQKGYENICHVLSKVHDHADADLAGLLRKHRDG